MQSKNEILAFLSKNKSYLKEKYHIDKIALFGSYARDEAGADSDIDLTYIMEENQSITYSQFFELEDFFKKSLPQRIELVNFRYMNPVIKKCAEEDLIYV